jgi:ABC-type sugar transport system permease subunit
MSATAATPRRMRVRRGLLSKAPPSLTGFLLFLPAILMVGAIQIYPLLRGVALSLEDPETGGFTTANYERMLDDPAWHKALENAGKILLLVPLFVVVPLFVAFALWQAFRGWRFFRAVFFLSWLLPPTIVGYMFKPLLAPAGPLNTLLEDVGLEGVARPWLGDPATSLWTVMAIFLWSVFGLGVGVYLAGLATVPPRLVEAARLDGARGLRILRHVVAPLLWPTIALWSVMVVVMLLLGLYGFLFALTDGGPAFASLTPEYYIVKVLRQEVNPQYAAALGTTLFLGVLIVVVLQMRLVYGRILGR